MLILSNAKINLGLHVLAKRPDGYHNLQTIFYPIQWADIVEVVPGAGADSFCVYGNNPFADDSQNICMQALRLLRGHFDIPYANIYLYKRVPHGAGLGGGSSNGAAVLMAANAAFDLNIGERQLALYAAMLGSDCAFFVHGIPMLAHGRGEILTPVPFSLHGYWLLAVKADISINTAAAYSRVVPCGERPDLQDIIGQPIWAWRGLLVNDFEAAAFGDYPILAHIKARMYDLGALYASMTGSGSAIYGIFGSPPYQAQHEFAKYITYCQQF